MIGYKLNFVAIMVYALLLIACSSESEEVSEYPMLDCERSFEFKADEDVERVSLVGDFNRWIANGYDLQKWGDGTFHGTFTIGKGRYAYRFDVDGELMLDPANPLTIYGKDGEEHSVLIADDCSLPAWRVDSANVDEGRYEVSLTFLASMSGPPLDPESVVASLDKGGIEALMNTEKGKVEIVAQAPIGKHNLIVGGKDEDGNPAQTLTLPFWIEDNSFDWSDAVIYQIVVDRFRKGDGVLDVDRGMTMRMGGDYAGIAMAIEEGYFERLGVNALWISPAYTNASGLWPGFDGRQYEAYHGYWPVDSRSVDPAWGGDSALDTLVDVAHEKGMRIILDVVPNHVHSDHPQWKRHPEYFNYPDIDCVCGRECSWFSDIDHCWFTDYLPDYDWTEAEVMDQVVPDVMWWVSRFDVDGLRVDAVPMMPRLATRHLRYSAQRLFGQGGYHLFMIGETFTGTQGRPQIRRYLGPEGLSGQFDFPLMWAMRSIIGKGEGRMDQLLDEIDSSRESWQGSGSVMGHIVGNHDVARFISDIAEEPEDDEEASLSSELYSRLAIAFTILFSIPGAPVVYYGDEFGMAGMEDPDNRRPMRFGEDLDPLEKRLLEKVARLGRLRSLIPALRHGERLDLHRGEDVIAYAYVDESSQAIAVLSRSSKASRITFDLPAEIKNNRDEDLKDCFGRVFEMDDNGMDIVLEPLGMMLIANGDICNASD